MVALLERAIGWKEKTQSPGHDIAVKNGARQAWLIPEVNQAFVGENSLLSQRIGHARLFDKFSTLHHMAIANEMAERIVTDGQHQTRS